MGEETLREGTLREPGDEFLPVALGAHDSEKLLLHLRLRGQIFC